MNKQELEFLTKQEPKKPLLLQIVGNKYFVISIVLIALFYNK